MECMTISELRIELRETMDRVAWENQTILIRKHGKDVGVLMPATTYFNWEKESKAFSNAGSEPG